MRPISLHGHERSVTQIRYNREGDLLFSAAKDPHPNVWYSINGERLGTYDGHSGAVWTIDVDWETKNLLSGSADNSVRLWDVCTGKMLKRISTQSAVRTCAFSYSGKMAAYSTDKQMGYQCFINIIDAENFDGAEPIWNIAIPPNGPKVTALVWDGLDRCIVTGHDNGDIVKWNMKTQQKEKVVSNHSKAITDLQTSADCTMFISSSKDHTGRLWDMASLECLHTYKTERPVNSASISPIYDHVVMGGGQEAMDVTMTSTKVGKFDARFYHLVFEEEFGNIKGHFGPINSVCFHPDGQSYASGGEDGYVRINVFDQDYHKFDYEY